MFGDMVRVFIGKAHDAGKLLTADDAMKCAALKIHVMRTQGIRMATAMKVGKIPADYPDVELKAPKAKRERKAAPGESEAEIQREIIKYLCKAEWLVIRINSSAMKVGDRYLQAYRIENTKVAAGLTDVLACKRGRWVLFEVKTEKGKLSDSQKDFHELAKSFGADVRIVRSVAEVMEIDRSMTRQVQPVRNQIQTTMGGRV